MTMATSVDPVDAVDLEQADELIHLGGAPGESADSRGADEASDAGTKHLDCAPTQQINHLAALGVGLVQIHELSVAVDVQGKRTRIRRHIGYDIELSMSLDGPWEGIRLNRATQRGRTALMENQAADCAAAVAAAAADQPPAWRRLAAKVVASTAMEFTILSAVIVNTLLMAVFTGEAGNAWEQANKATLQGAEWLLTAVVSTQLSAAAA
jgi:hypothetical protein